ncbi:thrombospondin type 1 domain containing lonely heart isoform X2 [Leptinotarsa decemlineata]|uniref:thrombospondin type 1 domain containing lonely heart isoform X2 n=1 Tax=Leptinotarsa decemlineata TaxID=7539 RepID=UPI003D308855
MIRAETMITAVFVSVSMCNSQKMEVQQRKDRRPHKYPVQIHRMFRDQLQKKIPKNLGEWSAWSSWTPCSRSCGGGITQQTRNCVNRPADSRFARRQRRRRQNARQPSGCVGLYKRIHLCNSQDCPSGRDFRYEQCASFNNRLFRGTRHQWEPFLKVKDECALNCRAVGMNFFATLNKTVIDGTRCLYPSTYTGKTAPKGTRGVCIDGYCKVVNSRGVIGSLDEEQEECAACLKGTCRSINGIYTRPDLPPGYSLVAQIPAGACRVLVQQLKHTRNFLAIKNTNGSFIVNGEWKQSNSRVFQGAGTKFVYIRQDENSLETLTSPGPLAHSVDIMIVNYQTNYGIKYGYSLPIAKIPAIAPPSIKRPIIEPMVLETRKLDTSFNTSFNQRDEARPPVPHRRTRLRRKHFHWKITGLTACSKSCGGGFQNYVRVCTREAGQTQVPVSERKCAHLRAPSPPPIHCNTEPCPPSWHSRWTDCSVTCGDGVQQNIPECRQDLVAGSVPVSESQCSIPKPTSQTRICQLSACESLSDNELPRTFDEHKFNALEWSAGPWSQCSVSCGTGHRTRSVTCPSGRCRPEDRPPHAEYCNVGSCNVPAPPVSDSHTSTASHRSISVWLTTEWSHCSEDCGTGTQKRFAVCAYQDRDSCKDDVQPELSRACSSDKQCDGQWFTGPWSTCSDSCSGSALQKREVFCVVKIRGRSHITNEMTCPGHLKPSEEQPCDGVCPSHWFFGDWRTCEGTCPIGVQRREVRCLDIHGRQANGCPENDMPVAKRTCACESKADNRDRSKPVQDEPVDRSCVDRINKCKLALQARLCHYPYYVSHCCESCRRAKDLLE